MSEFHFYEPRQGHGLPHDPFKAIVAPRPIGWISSLDEHGRVNLAPYSFFNAFCESPPIIGFSSGGRKDSQRNIQVVGVHIDKAFLKEGIFDLSLVHPIARCGYRGDYAEVTRLFEMLRPGVTPVPPASRTL